MRGTRSKSSRRHYSHSSIDSPNEASKKSKLQSLIEEACKPNCYDPNIDLALEICELVNSKTSYARTSTELLCKYFEGDDEAQCILAVFLLDLLVINGGYPMHLVISKRDFLNKLVYRFPPTPNFGIKKTHEFILKMIKKWTIALCDRSEHRSDFGNIRLMYSLLSSKGFRFPKVTEAEIQAITPKDIDKIKTREEIVEEQRLVYEAKLEDLLQRNDPNALKAANELMKVMSGYEESGYSVADSIIENKLLLVADKKKLLEELLWNTDPSQYPQNESIQQLLKEMQHALPGLTKLTQSDLKEETLAKVLDLHQAITHIFTSLNMEIAKIEVDKSQQPSQSKDKGASALEHSFSLLSFDDDAAQSNTSSTSTNQAISLSDEFAIELPLTPTEDKCSETMTVINPLTILKGSGMELHFFPENVLLLLNQTATTMSNVIVNIRININRTAVISIPRIEEKGCCLLQSQSPNNLVNTPEATVTYQDELGLSFSITLQ